MRINRLGVVAMVGTTLLVGGTLGRASAAGDPAVINACAGKNGSLRLVANPQDCRDAESPVQWNASGPAGPQGAPGVSGYEIATVVHLVPPGLNELMVTCPGEKVVTGGGEENTTGARTNEQGHSVTPDSLRVRASRPDGTTAWKVIVHNNGTLDGRMQIYALCANAV